MFKRKYILILILAFALMLRLFNLSKLPMYGDELTLVYDSYSLLKTGHDQTGQFLPLTFRMGAGRPAGYVYASIPFVGLFGPSALGVRMLSILSGLGIITLIYLMVKRLFNQNVAITSAIFAAISPWELSLSRGGFEAHFALFLVLLGTYSFLLSEKKPWHLMITTITFGLAIHTYPIYKLVLPLIAIGLIYYAGWFRYKFISANRKIVFLSLITGLLFIVVSIFQTVYAGSEQRFTAINVFSQQEILKKITREINYDISVTDLPLSISTLLHNKPTEYLKLLTNSYLKNYSVDFLFISGDGNPRHNMTGMGEMYWIDLLLIISGSLYLWGLSKKKFLLLIYWIAISPIAATLLIDTHALRSSFMLLPLLVLSSLGLYYLLLNRKLPAIKILIVIIAAIGAFQFITVLNNLYLLSPNKYARFWSSESKIASELAYQEKNKFDKVILSDKIDNIEYAYQVYNRIDPQEVISQNIKRKTLDEYEVKQYENVYIVGIPNTRMEDFINGLDGSILFLGDFGEEGKLIANFDKIETGDRIKYLIRKTNK
jgi:4-amino-4-deoxy-L-arabinose transferase-like glycosyltransferase